MGRVLRSNVQAIIFSVLFIQSAHCCDERLDKRLTILPTRTIISNQVSALYSVWHQRAWNHAYEAIQSGEPLLRVYKSYINTPAPSSDSFICCFDEMLYTLLKCPEYIPKRQFPKIAFLVKKSHNDRLKKQYNAIAQEHHAAPSSSTAQSAELQHLEKNYDEKLLRIFFSQHNYKNPSNDGLTHISTLLLNHLRTHGWPWATEWDTRFSKNVCYFITTHPDEQFKEKCLQCGPNTHLRKQLETHIRTQKREGSQPIVMDIASHNTLSTQQHPGFSQELKDEIEEIVGQCEYTPGRCPMGMTREGLCQSIVSTLKKYTHHLSQSLEHEWPVIDDYAVFPWLTVLCNNDRALQLRALDVLQKQWKSGKAPAFFYAYLFDRMRLHEGLPQYFGTQTNTNSKPFDNSHHDSVLLRQKLIGINKTDYKKMTQFSYEHRSSFSKLIYPIATYLSSCPYIPLPNTVRRKSV